MKKETMRKELHIDKKLIDKYNDLMKARIIDYDKENIPCYSTIAAWMVDFGDGFQMDIKVCSSNHNNPLWFDAVLFKEGHELSCTCAETTLDREWELESYDRKFIINIIPS